MIPAHPAHNTFVAPEPLWNPRDRPSRVLLLQGPVGPFFWRLARELESFGCVVTKINFNAGDWIFYRGGVSYRGSELDWKPFLDRILGENDIETVCLFGDCRPIHQDAIAMATARGIQIRVFEEGYLRPDFITLERNGVNGNSAMPSTADAYRLAAQNLVALDAPVALGRTFLRAMWYAVIYSIFLTLGRFRYPRYQHHRCFNMWKQSFYWVRSGWRKAFHKVRERGELQRLIDKHAQDYFFVPLQVHCDSQIQHSEYPDVRDFIGEVIAEFSRSAALSSLLVLKHHPRDRGYRDYRVLIAKLGRQYGCSDRLIYLHDQHLPTLLRHARGTITINSTVGLSSLYHRTPVKVMGQAVYNIPGLTDDRSLAEFFVCPQPIDFELYQGFTRYLRYANQVNGSFYKRLATDSFTGLYWPVTEYRKRTETYPPTAKPRRSTEHSKVSRASSEVRAASAEKRA